MDDTSKRKQQLKDSQINIKLTRKKVLLILIWVKTESGRSYNLYDFDNPLSLSEIQLVVFKNCKDE